MKIPTLSVDILVIKDNKVLLGLLSEEWSRDNKPTYGLPGREINFGETFSEAVERNIAEELDCKLLTHSIIAINANYALDNHFVGIGVIANIEGEPKNMKPDDWQKWEWVGLNDLPDNLFPPARNLMQSYLQHKITVSD
jgi:ADP-ribose pyrophosphatase YjhB (NUDIX family)